MEENVSRVTSTDAPIQDTENEPQQNIVKTATQSKRKSVAESCYPEKTKRICTSSQTSTPGPSKNIVKTGTKTKTREVAMAHTSYLSESRDTSEIAKSTVHYTEEDLQYWDKEKSIKENWPIDVSRLILLVKERPILWHPNLEDLTNECWTEVLKGLKPDIEEDDEPIYCNVMRKKWTEICNKYADYVKNETAGFKYKYKEYLFYKKNLKFLYFDEEESEAGESDENSEDDKSVRNTMNLIRETLTIIKNHVTKTPREERNRHAAFIESLLPSLNEFTNHQCLDFYSQVINIVKNKTSCAGTSKSKTTSLNPP